MVVLSVGVQPPKDLAQDLAAAHAVEDLRRLLHGGAPQAQAGRRAHARRLLRRLLRVAQGHQGLGLPGGRRGVARRRAAQRGQDPDRGDHEPRSTRRRARSAACAPRSAPTARSSGRRARSAAVVEAACAGCGACGATCQFGAITMRHFTDDQIMAQVERSSPTSPQDKVVRLRLQLVLVRRRRHGGHLAHPVPGHEPRGPHDVLGARLGGDGARGVPLRRAGGAGLRLPLRRLPLHQRQPADGQARPAAVGQAGEGRASGPSGCSSSGSAPPRGRSSPR